MLKAHKLNSNLGIVIGVCITFLGIGIMSFNYLSEKKQNAYLSMNIKLFENSTPKKVENKKELSNLEKEEESIRIEEASSSNNNSDYSYYKGVLEIPKIGLKRGFVEPTSPHNNISENVTILEGSKFPSEKNSNLMLAAHSGDGYIAFFRNLYKLNRGDEAYIYFNKVKYTYKIKNIYTQPKTGEIEIKRNRERTTLTLITCTKDDDKTQTVYILELED